MQAPISRICRNAVFSLLEEAPMAANQAADAI
jgi:hypothetical protein